MPRSWFLNTILYQKELDFGEMAASRAGSSKEQDEPRTCYTLKKYSKKDGGYRKGFYWENMGKFEHQNNDTNRL